MNAVASTHLYYAEGSSNKEYHAEILAVPGGNVVNFRYGRRGGTLNCGTKTETPVDLDSARKIYDKLIQSKTTKGYIPSASGVPYQNTDEAGLKTGFMPQLLNPISESEAMDLIQNNHWAAQEKMDGERRAVHADHHSVIGINRKGLNVPLPLALANELQAISTDSGAIRVDGEIIGDLLYVFDLHVHQGKSTF